MSVKAINSKNLYPRTILADLKKEIIRDSIIVIVGSRQVGKTSLLALLYEEIGNKPKAYFDLEDIQLLDEFNNLTFDDFPAYLEEKANLSLVKRVYVFIDEIQYLDNPSSFLKYIFDHYKKIKFIVSGSSTLEIKKKFTDRLTGRKALYVLYPLGFEEFLIFKNRDFKIRKDLNLRKLFKEKNERITDFYKKRLTWAKPELNGLFKEFLIFGGYPRIALTSDKNQKVDALKEIQATYIRKDIKDLAEIENTKVYNNLIETLASQNSNLLNIDELTNTLQANRKTVERYLFLLENTFIINLLKPFYTNKRREITKMPKIFLKDNGLRNALVKDFSPIDKRLDKSALVESFVYTELKKSLGPLEELYFWRTQTKAEVDFVIKEERGRLFPIEVKYKTVKEPRIPSGLRSFISVYRPEKAFVITENLLDERKFNRKTTIYFLPAFLV